ncbi:erg10, acetyl-CoA C-acetyltransferase [Terramyces sp. JEL0728]|nr:erg10, acetyl-CoA C-acetyltransferase [Terramyces sp. JEL0728]
MFRARLVQKRFSSVSLKEVVIVSATRTPTGAFGKSLKGLTGPQLGAVAIKGAVEKAGLKPEQIEEVYMGNVVSAGAGQAPARQATLFAGLPESTEATTINKVCASGLKAVMLAAQNLQTGQRDIMVAGGFESMSNVPFYFPRNAAYGNQVAKDGILHDGLTDPYNNIHMGSCAEGTAKEHGITREQQDEFAISSYTRASEAWKKGAFKEEITPIVLKSKKGDVVFAEDEGYKDVSFSKLPSLRPAFEKNGTITAANASTLNDGASAVVLMTREKANELGVKPLAKIISFADAATDPKKFAIAPSLAIPKALEKAGISVKDVDLFEINEAFSVVIRANEKILGIDPKKVNVNGGGVSLGHPIGSSGSRILVTLVHLLEKGQVGCAAICNGGGAASSMVIQKE